MISPVPLVTDQSISAQLWYLQKRMIDKSRGKAYLCIIDSLYASGGFFRGVGGGGLQVAFSSTVVNILGSLGEASEVGN